MNTLEKLKLDLYSDIQKTLHAVLQDINSDIEINITKAYDMGVEEGEKRQNEAAA